MFKVGLTGGMGSGKSTVAAWLREVGFPVLDADKTVHILFEEDSELISLIKREFGPEVITEIGVVDRKALGRLVFQDKTARQKLESLVHPIVLRRMQTVSETFLPKGEKLIFWDVPLLYEAKFEKEVDEVWLIWVPDSIQVERIRLRDNLSNDEIDSRIEAQIPLSEKLKYADVVIDNSQDWKKTVQQLEEELKRIKLLSK